MILVIDLFVFALVILPVAHLSEGIMLIMAGHGPPPGGSLLAWFVGGVVWSAAWNGAPGGLLSIIGFSLLTTQIRLQERVAWIMGAVGGFVVLFVQISFVYALVVLSGPQVTDYMPTYTHAVLSQLNILSPVLVWTFIFAVVAGTFRGRQIQWLKQRLICCKRSNYLEERPGLNDKGWSISGHEKGDIDKLLERCREVARRNEGWTALHRCEKCGAYWEVSTGFDASPDRPIRVAHRLTNDDVRSRYPRL